MWSLGSGSTAPFQQPSPRATLDPGVRAAIRAALPTMSQDAVNALVNGMYNVMPHQGPIVGALTKDQIVDMLNSLLDTQYQNVQFIEEKPQPTPSPPYVPPSPVNPSIPDTGFHDPTNTQVFSSEPMGMWPGDVKDKNDYYIRDPGNPRSKARAARQALKMTKTTLPGAIVEETSLSSQPAVNMKSNAVVIDHSEIYSSIYLGTSDAVISLPNQGKINPGFSFKWLRGLAAMFEKYEFLSLTFTYVNDVSTSSGGRITIGWDPDLDDYALVTTSAEVNALVPNATGPLFRPLTRNVPAKFYNTPRVRYIRHADIAPATVYDIHNYDAGRLFISGYAGTAATVGNIWVTYKVKLTNPHVVLDPPIFASDKLVSTPVSRTDLFGSGYVWSSGGLLSDPARSPMGFGVLSPLAATVTCITPGQYLMQVEIGGTAIAGAPTITTGSSLTCALISSIYNAAGTAGMYIYRLNVPISGAGSMIFDYTPACTTLTAWTARFMVYHYAYAKPAPKVPQQLLDRCDDPDIEADDECDLTYPTSPECKSTPLPRKVPYMGKL